MCHYNDISQWNPIMATCELGEGMLSTIALFSLAIVSALVEPTNTVSVFDQSGLFAVRVQQWHIRNNNSILSTCVAATVSPTGEEILFRVCSFNRRLLVGDSISFISNLYFCWYSMTWMYVYSQLIQIFIKHFIYSYVYCKTSILLVLTVRN